jgi:eukaryotic-like serine/threonine-protein kinase
MTARFTPLYPDDPAEVAGYALRARLGSGGMGTVYLSFSRGGRPVAIKVVKREFADDAEFRRRFAREITAAQQVQGHFTAPVVDADPNAPVPWLATAYIAGPSLQDAVGEYGPFPPFTVFRLLAGAAEGIAAVHQAGLIHRDLKPANVLLAADGPRVIDFGIAHAADSSTLTGKGHSIGTPAYMAPEQIRGGEVTAATDVFGLGQLAVFAATGHAAFGEGPTEALIYRILNERPNLADCPAELRPIAERCLARDPADRPGVGEVIDYARDSMRGGTMRVLDEPWLPASVAAALSEYAPTAAPPVPPPTTVVDPPAPRPQPKRSLLRTAVVVPAVVVLAVGGFFGYLLGHSPGPGPKPNPSPTKSTSVSPATPGTSAPASSTAPISPPPSTPTDPGSSYPQEWSGQQLAFTMPGGTCSAYFPSSVTFDEAKGPVVTATGNKNSGDMFLNCLEGDGPGTPAGLSFDGHPVASVTGNPSANDCVTAIDTSPLPSKDILLPKLSAGMQFCLTDSDSNLLVHMTLMQVNQVTQDLKWEATAWSLTGS